MNSPASKVLPDDGFATGLPLCYEILLYLSSRMAKLSPGDIFEFITDDADAEEKIPSWCEARDFTLLSMELLPDSRRRFLIQK